MKWDNNHNLQNEQTLKRLAQRSSQLLSKGMLPLPENESVTIILHSTHPDRTSVCLSTLLACTKQHGQIVIVPEYDDLRDHLKHIQQEMNRQIGLSVHFLMSTQTEDVYNLALARAYTKFVVLLSDRVIVTPDWLTRLLWPFYDDTSVGMTGPCSNIGFETEGREIHPSATISEMFAFASEIQKAYTGIWKCVPFLEWICLVASRSLMEQIGVLDFTFRTHEMRVNDWSRRTTLTEYSMVLCQDVYIHALSSHYPGTEEKEQADDWKRLYKKWQLF